MKARNSKEVTRGYLLFAIAMCCTILTGIGCIWSFVLTAEREVARMDIRSQEYDAVFAQQIVLTEKVDSLYNNLARLNSGKRINEVLLQNKISTQKMNLIGILEQMNGDDALLYNKLSEQINPALQAKDSIRILNLQVEQVKADLQRCMQDNRTATRRMIFTNPAN